MTLVLVLRIINFINICYFGFGIDITNKKKKTHKYFVKIKALIKMFVKFIRYKKSHNRDLF
jgi:hypothetical protein